MEATELLKSLVEEVRQLAKTETVVGEPITVAGHTIIPISRVAVGFGGGAGGGEAGDQAKHQRGTGSGGGGGGGVKVEPAVFIVSKGDELSIMAAPGKRGAFTELFEHLPDLVEKMTAAKKGEQTSDDGDG